MRAKQRGVTLMELMVTVGIVGIIAAIAYPNYRQYVVRSNRSEARNELMEAAQRLERCYTHDRTYVACAGVNWGPTATGLYSIGFTAGEITASAFRIVATPQGAQAISDQECARFVMTEVRRSATNSSAADTTATCWR